MGQGIHARLGGGVGRQGYGEQRVQHGAAGDQAQVADGVLVVVRAGDYGGNGGLGAGAGGGGHGNEGRNGAAHLQKPRHLGQRPVGTGQQGGGSLGRVHGTAAAHGHEAVALLCAVQGGDGLRLGHRRVRRHAGIAAGAVLLQQVRQAAEAAGTGDGLRPAPGQQAGAQPEGQLVGTIPQMQ